MLPARWRKAWKNLVSYPFGLWVKKSETLPAGSHYRQISNTGLEVRKTGRRTTVARRIGDGNFKTLVDSNGGSGGVCAAGCSSVVFSSADGYWTVCRKSCSERSYGCFGDSVGAGSE